MTEVDESEGASYSVAIVGASGRYPGARTLDEFWRNLCEGKESVRRFTDEELLAAGEAPEALSDPSYVKAWPVLEDIDLFDAGFFGMSPRDAAVMDPQHRIFLEVAWEALEDAGYDPERTPGPTGVFAACGMNTYMMHHLVTNREVMANVGEWLVRHTGNDMNFLATRVSYQMNLKGPSLNVQTACSSSLVAVHLACQSLLAGECDMALAGASTLSLPQDRGYFFREGEILSPDGTCRPFDAASAGTLFGSGAGCIVLKRLDDARRDGDRVLAIVRGSAINNDGSVKIGYLAPGVDGQARCVSEAIAVAGVDPESISYIEAHGTGTALGDPIEIAALSQAFGAHTEKRQFCAIGSVKGNIGHIGEAAGMAGIAKTALALRHRKLPPSLHFERPNPEIDFAASPVFVNARLTEWKGPGGPLRAGVTSLGAGGTNAHVVLEEAPAEPPPGPSRPHELVVLSAKTASALDAMSDRLAAYLRANPGLELGDVAHTLQAGRRAFAHRRSVVATSTADLAAVLESRDAKRVASAVVPARTPSVAFLFPGGGAQYPGMGVELYRTEPVFRQALDECFAALEPSLGRHIARLVLEPSGDAEAAKKDLGRPPHSIPSVFSASYATARLLLSWGVEPAAMIGHSLGEYVAATLAGVMSLGDALSLLALRGHLMEKAGPGAMLGVPLPEAEVRALLGSSLSLAVVNAKELCVVSGPSAAIDALAVSLEAREVECARIHISAAAHSAMLDPVLPEFARRVRAVRLAPPERPFISNLTGTFIRAEEATDPDYWVRHLRETVRFGDGLAALVGSDERVLLEVGPGRTLTSLVKRQHPEVPSLCTLRHPQETTSDVAFLLSSMGRLFAHGAPPSFPAMRGEEQRRRIPLPTYPFERKRYWVDRRDALSAAGDQPATGPLRKKTDVTEWFYAPCFKRAPAVAAPPTGNERYLVFMDEAGLGESLVERLGSANVVTVKPGWAYAKRDDGAFEIRPGHRTDYEAVLESLAQSSRLPDHVVHLWAVAREPIVDLGGPAAAQELAAYDEMHERCFDSLLLLAQVFGAREDAKLTLTVVTNELHALSDEKTRRSMQALVLGPVRVIPREMPHIRTRHVDLRIGRGLARKREAAEALERELRLDADDRVVALRGGERWVESYERAAIGPVASGLTTVRHRSVVLITGGLGGIGLEVAEHLARKAQARLVLLGRSRLPPRADWDAWLAAHGSGDLTSHRIRKLRAIEALGSEVLTLGADVADRQQLEGALLEARAHFGRIDGVIHGAGHIDDGLIALKEPNAARAVIAPKVKGALLLDALLAKERLDFFVVFSSVSSILGLEGQVDYTAANAFLDAFAHRLCGDGRTRALSIHWNAWQEVGMAVALADRGVSQAPQAVHGKGTSHPLLGRAVRDDDSELLVETTFSRADHWLLAEHVLHGAEALVPGTGYLELARGACELRNEGRTVELRDVFFLSPFSVKVGETRVLRLRLGRSGADEGAFAFTSEDEAAPHVTGSVSYVDAPPPPRADLAALRARTASSEQKLEGFLDQPFVDFGPRWGNVFRIGYGAGEALLDLELPAPYGDDLRDFHLHPALLDMATGAAQRTIPGFDPARDFYIPFSYGRLRLFAPLGRALVSHVRHRPSHAKDLQTFDVTIHDPEGGVLAEITGFVMKRVDPALVIPRQAAKSDGQVTRLGAVVQQGILPAEGVEAFDRMLASGARREIVACSVDLAQWLANVDEQSRPRDESTAAPAGEESAFGRTPLRADYVAPRDDVERTLAGMWRQLLGVVDVGIHDDFFEVGGQSLVAVRLFNRIRKQYGVDLPLSTLFEAPTIAAAAEVIRREAGLPPLAAEAAPPEPGRTPDATAPEAAPAPAAEPAPAPAPTNGKPARSRWRSLVLMQPKGTLTPLFFIAGMGGTLNNLRQLAKLLGEDRRVYGLQPPGADDESERLYQVEALAAHYLKEIRSVQPVGPYYLGGYSGGGVAAFEISRILEQSGEKVAFLAFLDSFSPALPLRPLQDRAKIHLKRIQNHGPSYVFDTISRRVYYQSSVAMRRINRELGRFFPHRYRYDNLADSWAVAESQYRPGPSSGRATLFRARDESALSLWTAIEVDAQHGWGRYLKGGVEVVICPGDHTTMCEEPHVRALAQRVRESVGLAARDAEPAAATSSPGSALAP